MLGLIDERQIGYHEVGEDWSYPAILLAETCPACHHRIYSVFYFSPFINGYVFTGEVEDAFLIIKRQRNTPNLNTYRYYSHAYTTNQTISSDSAATKSVWAPSCSQWNPITLSGSTIPAASKAVVTSPR